MNTFVQILIALTVLSSCFHGEAKTRSIRFGVLDATGYPLFARGQPNPKGILVDISNLLSSELNANLQIQMVPRKRVEKMLASGEVDIICYLSPKWLEFPERLDWTLPMLSQNEHAVVLATNDLPTNFTSDLYGKKVALILGYKYPELDQVFTAKSGASRIDKRNPESLFASLISKGSDVIITSQMEIEGYFYRHPERRSQFSVSAITLSTVQTQCAVSKKSEWSKQDFDRAIQAITENKKLESIETSYKAN